MTDQPVSKCKNCGAPGRYPPGTRLTVTARIELPEDTA